MVCVCVLLCLGQVQVTIPSQPVPNSLFQHCYDHCKSKVMDLIAQQLDRLFSVHKPPSHHPLNQPTLSDLSIAYGLLLKGCVTDAQCLSDQLCQEVDKMHVVV